MVQPLERGQSVVESVRPLAEGQKETLATGVEIHFGDPKLHAADLARLFTQPSTIEHLAGIAPPGIDLTEWQERYPHYKFRVATEEVVRRSFEENQDRHLLVALLLREVVGTITVETPGPGLRFSSLVWLAVGEQHRGQGYGRKLIRAANAYSFDRKVGLDCVQARAIVILGIEGAPQELFRKERYVSGPDTTARTCFSWNPRLRKFLPHNAAPMYLDREDYRGNVERDFPLLANPPQQLTT